MALQSFSRRKHQNAREGCPACGAASRRGLSGPGDLPGLRPGTLGLSGQLPAGSEDGFLLRVFTVRSLLSLLFLLVV